MRLARTLRARGIPAKLRQLVGQDLDGTPRCWRPWPPARPTLPRRSCGGPCARVLFGALCGDALYGRCERAASGEIL